MRLTNLYACGDYQDILQTLPDKSVDLFFTSPPDISELGLDKDLAGYKLWQRTLIFFMEQKVKDTGFIVISQADRKMNGGIFSKLALNIEIIAQHTQLKLKDHKIVIFGKADRKCLYAPNYQHCVAFSKDGTFPRKGDMLRPILNYERNKIKGAQKKTNTWPEDYVELIVENFSPKGGIVVDPCAGPGVVYKIARKLGRLCVSTEIDEEIFKVGQNYIDDGVVLPPAQ